MERYLVGFMIFLATFTIGVCIVDPRLVFEGEEESKCFAGSVIYVLSPMKQAPKVRS